MNVKRPVTPEIIIGDQPSEEDLLECKYEGYAGVVNSQRPRARAAVEHQGRGR